MKLWRLDLCAVALLAALAIVSSCGKDSDEKAGKRGYEIIEYAQFTPGEFADYAYDGEDETWGKSYQIFMKAMNAIVKAKNLVLGPAMSVEAGHIGAAWGYRKYFLNYPSTDAQGRPITLSEVVIVPVGIGWSHKPDKIFLGSHYTIFADYERPTGIYADYLTGTAACDAVFICPDLEGYGAAADRPHPFMAHDVVARQTVDGALAALSLLKDEGLHLKDGYRLYSGGYSQGGSYALAVHKYIETQCTQAQRDLLHLAGSLCGGGPYSPLETWKWYSEQDDIYYTCVLPLMVLSMMYSYPEFFNGIEAEDFFTTEFVEAGVLDMVLSKEYSSSFLRPYIIETVGNRVDSILSEEALTPGSRLQVAIEKALAACDLTYGWKPASPVVLFHTEADQYVPYLNASLALDGLGGDSVTLRSLPNLLPSDPHNGVGIYYYLKLVIGGLE